MRDRSTMLLRVSAGLALCVMLAGCASLAARSTYSRGVKARDRGDLRPAIAAFQEAYRADPKPEYAEALKKAQAEVARGEVQKAEAAEASGQFTQAAEHWGAALELAPDNGGLMARKGLAELETRQPDPVERHRVIAELIKVAPNDKVVQVRLQEAERSAVKYHLRMARMYRDVRSWRPAYRAYEKARALQPKNPIFDGAIYRDVVVREYEAQGDQKLAGGDTLGAYEAYEAAVKVRPSRRLKTKMNRARRGAGPVLEQIRQAETFARLQKWEDAAEIYSIVAGRAEAPKEVRAQSTVARAKSAGIRAERALAYADRNLLDKAVAELRLALEHSDGAIDAIQAMGIVVDALEDQRPEVAQPKVEQAQSVAPNLAVVKAASTIVQRFATRLFARAQAQADKDPAEALLLISRLVSFQSLLPGYATVKKRLVKTAFAKLLERAEQRAEQQRFTEATEGLSSALAIANPPASLAAPLKAGLDALKASEWSQARAAFRGAVASNARSRLAKAGLAVARKAHLSALRQEAKEARSVDDLVRASAVYRDILGLEPDDAEAQGGLLDLRIELVEGALKSARAHLQAERFGAAFVYFHRITTLDPEHAEAKAGLQSLKDKLGAGQAAMAYVAPLQRAPALQERCRGVERAARDRVALYLNRTPGLGITFLEADALQAVDSKKSPAPPVQLTGSVTVCAPTKTGGTLELQAKLQSGPSVVFDQRFSAKFDPSSVPKDELQDGLAARRVVMELLGQVAKKVSKQVKADAGRLAGWRVHLAKDRMKAGDAEGAARAYAALLGSKAGLSGDEQGALESLERYLNNRFR